MKQLRYVAIAAALLLGCRKEGSPVQEGSGAGPVQARPGADAAPPVDVAPAIDAAPPVDAAPVVDAAPAVDARPAADARPAGGGGTPGGGKGSAAGAAQGQPCQAGQCAPGLSCIEYFGIAGPRGGKFTSCEIRCGAGGACPAGQQCTTIADGPGQVCRP